MTVQIELSPPRVSFAAASPENRLKSTHRRGLLRVLADIAT